MKQLLFILTTDADGGVPVQFRTADGNTNDSITHIETWTTLRTVAGRADFLYVADSKLCSHDNLSFIDRAGGRFVTVMPRSRREDKQFRKWLQTDTPSWELVWDRPIGPPPRWAARYLVRLPRSDRLGRRFHHHLGLEHLAHAAPAGPPSPQYRHRDRGAHGDCAGASWGRAPGCAAGRASIWRSS